MKIYKVLLSTLIIIILTGCSFTTKDYEDVVNRDIYGTFNTEYSFKNDPSILNNIIIDDYTTIVRVKIIQGDDDAIFVKEFVDNGSQMPHTPIKIKILEVLYGEAIDEDISTVYADGGNIKISELIKNITASDREKLNLDVLNDADKASKYISYESEFSTNYVTDKEYIIVLYKQSDSLYTIAANGYGTFETEDNSNYLNVITKKNFDTELDIIKNKK